MLPRQTRRLQIGILVTTSNQLSEKVNSRVGQRPGGGGGFRANPAFVTYASTPAITGALRGGHAPSPWW